LHPPPAERLRRIKQGARAECFNRPVGTRLSAAGVGGCVPFAEGTRHELHQARWHRPAGGRVLGLVYGGFSYTKDTTVVKLGPIEVTAKEKQTVNVPLWAGIGAIVAGGLLLTLGGRKS